MVDYRQLIIALIIAVLFAIFVNTTIEAFNPSPQYNDFCNETIYKPYRDPNMMNASERAAWDAEQMQIQEEQQRCNDAFNDAMQAHNFVGFIVSAIAGLIAVLIGIYIPVSNPVGMAIASGILLGGLFTIFFGTIEGWTTLGRTIKPLVILAELIIVIFVAYMKLSPIMEERRAEQAVAGRTRKR